MCSSLSPSNVWFVIHVSKSWSFNHFSHGFTCQTNKGIMPTWERERDCLVTMPRKSGKARRGNSFWFLQLHRSNSLNGTESDRVQQVTAWLPADHLCPLFPSTALAYNTFVDSMRNHWICNVTLFIIIDVGNGFYFLACMNWNVTAI